MITIENRTIKVSVRNFVEFLLRSGNLDNRRGSSDRNAMLEGGRVHRKIQKQMGSSYRAEVFMKYEVEREGYTFLIEGRADGIEEKKNQVLVDEIKGIYRSLESLTEPVPVHQAQAKCYGHIYCQQHGIKEITIQMTYCNLESEEIKRFQTVFQAEELSEWFEQLLATYLKWGKMVQENRSRRNESIKSLEFPFPYRKGQRDMTVSVYRTIHRKKKLFIQASTGIGKTMSTVFPAVKAVGEGIAEKIFYLTARTITRTVAYNSLQILKEQGLAMSVVILTAKEKICPLEKTECNPEACSYANGHFDRINEALYQLLQKEQDINRGVLVNYGIKYNVCPFELGLDVSSFTDVVIGDYNYAFDPNVYLRRFFGENQQGEYIFLIDEAHNLVDRARTMYSAVLYRNDLAEIKRQIGKGRRKLSSILNQCIKGMDVWEGEWDGKGILDNLGSIYEKLLRLFGELELWMEEDQKEETREIVVKFYLNLRHFLNMYDLLDESYEIYTEPMKDGNFFVKLFCITPANNLKRYLDFGVSTIFFSATMLPIRYYREMLSDEEEDYAVYIPSPFSEKNRLLAIGADVSSRYTRRSYNEYEKIVWYLNELLDGRQGNYMVFFPSYHYMNAVYEIAVERGLTYKSRIVIQESEMKEEEREEFLSNFCNNSKKSLLAFCVMGGVFSEGIDLAGEQLIGAVIVGTGIPQVCHERQLLKEHYDAKGENGFEYAYRYPAMNKVLQAAGRVIRTEEDKGVILLLDDRFLQRGYQELFPREWNYYRKVLLGNIQGEVNQFWNSCENI